MVARAPQEEAGSGYETLAEDAEMSYYQHYQFYTCRFCGKAIDRHAQVRVRREQGRTVFFHVEPDCLDKHLKEERHTECLNLQDDWADVSA